MFELASYECHEDVMDAEDWNSLIAVSLLLCYLYLPNFFVTSESYLICIIFNNHKYIMRQLSAAFTTYIIVTIDNYYQIILYPVINLFLPDTYFTGNLSFLINSIK